MSRQTRFEYFRRAGFFPTEARELSHISRTGMSAPYVVRLVASRRTLLQNARRYGWSATRYHDEVRAIYESANAFKYDALGRGYVDVWKLLREYEDRIPERERYESPWRKRLHVRSSTKKQQKYTTRKRYLQNWIDQLERTIERTPPGQKQEGHKRQLRNLREQLRRLG